MVAFTFHLYKYFLRHFKHIFILWTNSEDRCYTIDETSGLKVVHYSSLWFTFHSFIFIIHYKEKINAFRVPLLMYNTQDHQENINSYWGHYEWSLWTHFGSQHSHKPSNKTLIKLNFVLSLLYFQWHGEGSKMIIEQLRNKDIIRVFFPTEPSSDLLIKKPKSRSYTFNRQVLSVNIQQCICGQLQSDFTTCSSFCILQKQHTIRICLCSCAHL